MVDRGYLDEGMWADVVIYDPSNKWRVSKDNIHFKCGWSPLEGHLFSGRVESTIVSGHLAYHQGQFNNNKMGERLAFKGFRR